MIRVAHLRDEAEPGGVARMVAFLSDGLRGSYEHATVRVDPRQFKPLGIDADVLVVHLTAIWTKLPYLAALRALAPRRPLILVEHSYTQAFIDAKVAAPERFYVMLRNAYRLATHVVAVSHGQAEWLRRHALVPAQKLRVIRSATDMSGLATLTPPAPRHGMLHLGAYGRYAEQKGFDVLVEAMRRVPSDRVRLSIRGLGDRRHALLAAARDLPNVVVGGAAHNVRDFLETLDAVVIPSRWEAFGQVAAEARMAARPVIASAVDGLIEQIDPAYGWLVPADDPDALADAIAHLSALDLSELGLAARRSVERHGADHLAQWGELLASVVPDNRSSAAPARA
jgi:glycosyltransferase involved in cell wall biosynthesis